MRFLIFVEQLMERNCSPNFTAASSQGLKEATVVPSPCEAIIPAGSKAISIITDDINHLHSRINEEGHYVMARSDISDIDHNLLKLVLLIFPTAWAKRRKS
jgi:hypothetical protein